LAQQQPEQKQQVLGTTDKQNDATNNLIQGNHNMLGNQ